MADCEDTPIGTRLRQYREQCGKTQVECAAHLRISQAYYSLIENNERRLSVRTLLQLRSFFHLTKDQLYEVLHITDEPDITAPLIEGPCI